MQLTLKKPRLCNSRKNPHALLTHSVSFFFLSLSLFALRTIENTYSSPLSAIQWITMKINEN